MTAATTTPDRDLVRSYASEGSETAFRALVGRHVGLVFATALRQVGDTGLAEEITQNVFVHLARKAPSLAGHETIAGWLHRSAILESKARFRSEVRRRRREEVAAAFAEIPAGCRVKCCPSRTNWPAHVLAWTPNAKTSREKRPIAIPLS